MDTPDDGIQDDHKDGDGADPSKTEHTPEVLEKRLRDKDRYISQLQSEAKAAKEAAEIARTQSKFAEAVDRLAAKSGGKADDGVAEERAQFESMRDELAMAFREDETKGSQKSMELMAAYARDAEMRGEAKSKAEMTALKDELQAELKSLRERVDDQDPEVVPYREKIAELAAITGLDPKVERDRKALQALAKHSSKTEHPQRGGLPGSAGGGFGRAAASSGGGGSGMSLADMNALAEASGLPPVTAAEFRVLSARG